MKGPALKQERNRAEHFVQRLSMTEVAMQNSRTLGRTNSFMNPGFHRIAMALTIAAAFGLWGCGGSSTSSSAPTPPSLISVTVTPNSVTVLRDATQAFTAKVTGTSNTAVTWSVQESSERYGRQRGSLHASSKWGWYLSCHSDEPGQFGRLGRSRSECSDAPSND